MHFFLLFIFSVNFSLLQGLQVSNLSTLETLAPGEKKRIQLTLKNDKNVEELIELKLVDYSCDSTGAHFYDEPIGVRSNGKLRSNLDWIHLGQERVKLEPNEERTIYYFLEAPQDTSLNGSYWSVLLIEPAQTIPFEGKTEEGLSVNIVIRYAHHIITNVGNGSPKLKIIKKEIQLIDEKPHLCLHVKNLGTLFYNPAVSLKIYDKEGKLENTLQGSSERLYPGNSQCFYLPLSGLSSERIKEPIRGFILFDGKEAPLFGDRFTYP